MQRLFIGYYSGKNLFFPELRPFNMSQEERETSTNSKTYRDAMKKIVDNWRQIIKLEGENADQTIDFIGILLNDEEFKDDTDFIIDECSTFMIAASATTGAALQNELYYIARHKDVQDKMRIEIYDKILKQTEGETIVQDNSSQFSFTYENT